jgi:hypothetical protein
MAKTITIRFLEANLKRRIRHHLHKIGFERTEEGGLVPPNNTKETLRSLHKQQRNSLITSEKEFINNRGKKMLRYFASGNEIEPQKIKPFLEEIRPGTWQSDLFRVASLTWSIPVSQGYGRRMRFLVWDYSNEKLIGLIALGDPVFNQRARDEYIGWNCAQRKERLVDVMDAYVLGALPPYNLLLGGKLVAASIRTREVYNAFKYKYYDSTGLISKRKKKATLALVTTSSALGRSSVYNRVKLEGTTYLNSIGYTAGWGHFHIPKSLFIDMRAYLRLIRHTYADNCKFGTGPNWRIRVIRATLESLGMNPNILRHGINRQVFSCEMGTNTKKFLKGEVSRLFTPDLRTLDEVARMANERWIVPRSLRRPEYINWKNDSIMEILQKNAFDNSTLMRNNSDHELDIVNGICS